MRLFSIVREMLVDPAELGLRLSGIGLAAGSIAFAVHMSGQSGAPRINGVEHLAIYAQPNTLADRHARANGIDFTPIGATPIMGSQLTLAGYQLVEVVSGAALIRGPDGRVRRVVVGERLAGAGRVIKFGRIEGKWLVVTDAGLIRER